MGGKLMATILWIEGKRTKSPSFIPGLRNKGYDIETVQTGTQALANLSDVKPDLVVVDSASMRSNGKRICKSLRNQDENLPILVIADAEKVYSGDFDANIVLSLPFTIRKLNNRINRILPGEGGNVIRVGPIRLDLERKRVRCNDKESRLTPRLIILLKTLMTHEGEVLERKRLFKDIWETDYIGDTRTLDVHMSWLRQAIEADPRNPQYLKTIRGVGYRLDV
jgi:DNA-binding response OmpR family regulator